MPSSVPLPKEDLWQTLSRTEKPILLYGMGDGADKIIRHAERLSLHVSDVFASDDFVRGQTYRDRRVLTLSQAEEIYGDFTVLLAFATRLPEVIDRVCGIAARHTLYVPDLPVYGDEIFDLSLCRRYEKERNDVRALWYDDFSRDLFDGLVEARLTGALDRLLACSDPDGADLLRLLPADTFRCAVDAGAYNGDTVRQLLAAAPQVDRVLAIEPDPKTARRLSLYAASETRAAVSVYCGAAWSRETELTFSGKASRGAHLDGRSLSVTVPAAPIDALAAGMSVDYLKFDVEGAEAEALEGAADTIRRCRPTVLLSLYHRAADFFCLPLVLAALCPDYRFYLRRPRCLPAWETAMLAVPEERISK